MLLIQLEKNEDTQYKYQQIYNAIKKRILEGSLPAGEILPSKRKLAKNLHVSINSVTNAYEQLLAEGYIFAIERKGYYVENISQFLSKEKKHINKLPPDLKETPFDEEGWLSFSHLTSDISHFPFKTWIKCTQTAIKNHQLELSGISHPQGPYEVRKTISRLIAITRGVICEPEQIVIGPGTQPLLQKLMSSQSPNTTVAIENPGYSRFYTMLKEIYLSVEPVPIDDDGIDIEKLVASQANFVIVTPSHQFPTGIIMPISRRIQLLNWASQKENRFIIEDDYDSEFKYRTDNIPSLQSLNRDDHVIYTGTFSKTLLPGFRISYMVLPPKLLRTYQQKNADSIHTCNSLSLFTLHYFIESGEYERHIKRMNLYYEGKRNRLIKSLKNRFGSKIYIEDIPAGLHFYVTFTTSKSYAEIDKQAFREKLEIYTLQRFTFDKNYKVDNEISLVIGFTTIQLEHIEEAVERLYRVIL